MFSHLALEGHISFSIPQRAMRRSPHVARDRQIRRDVVWNHVRRCTVLAFIGFLGDWAEVQVYGTELLFHLGINRWTGYGYVSAG